MAKYNLQGSTLKFDFMSSKEAFGRYSFYADIPNELYKKNKYIKSASISIIIGFNTSKHKSSIDVEEPIYKHVDISDTYSTSVSLGSCNFKINSKFDISGKLKTNKEDSFQGTSSECYFEIQPNNVISSGVQAKNISFSSVNAQEDIKISWEIEDQDKAQIKISQNNEVVISKEVSTKYIDIPKNTFKTGECTVEIQPYVNVLSYKGDIFVINGEIASKIKTIVSTKPEIKKIITTDLNIDTSRQISWESEKQESYKLELNNKVYTGLKETSCMIAISSFVWGKNKCNLTVYNKKTGYSVEDSKEFFVNVTANNPTITALDPSDIDVNIDKPVIVTWNTIPKQHKFTLKANNQEYTGFQQMGLTIPVGIFKTSNNTITVTATRNILDQSLTGTKTVNFRGYGEPNKPVLDDKKIYSQSLPVFYWTSKRQISFRIQIYEGAQLVVESNEVVSKNKFYAIEKALKNNTKYLVKVKIKNKYGLWSDFAEKEISTSFEVIDPPTIQLFNTDGGVIINVSNEENIKFARSEVWRKDDYSDWKRIALNLPLKSSFKDNTIASNIKYYYKAITFTQSGGASESDIKKHSISLDKTFLVDLESNKSMEVLYSFSDTNDIKIKRIQDRKLVFYQGKNAPDIEIGEVDYTKVSMYLGFKNYTEFKEFQSFIDNSKVLIFKDKIGRKLYCSLENWGDEESNIFEFIGIKLNLVEVNFLEKDVFDGGRKLKLIRTDEGWKFDVGMTLGMLAYND